MTTNDQAAMNEQLTQLRLQGLSIDGDNRYKQDLIDAVIGAMMFGAQGANPPPSGHWLEQFYVIGREEREARAALANQPAAGEPVAEAWRPMDTAPKDGTMIRLLVEFTDNDVEDSEGPHPTIGSNTFEYSDIDEWMFAGWDWQQDQFCKGEGRPIGWLPMEYTAPPAAAHGDEAVRKDAERYRFLKDKGHFRTVSIDMGGNHTWTGLWRGIGKGSTVDEAIDAAIRAQGDGSADHA